MGGSIAMTDPTTATIGTGTGTGDSDTDLTNDALDAPQPVVLASVRGADTRRNLPKQYFRKKPLRFLTKFYIAGSLIAGGYVAIAVLASWPVTIAAIVVIGLMYAHLVELQHECLHEHAFRSRLPNRIYGFLSGLFMLSSYSHYKYDHLRHHAWLGKPNNQEFFNYRFHSLDSVPGFMRGAFHFGRYIDVFRDIGRALVGRPIPGVSRDRDRRRIQVEYRLFTLALAGTIAFTAWSGNLFFIFAWLLPLLLVAEPTHFLIELPEHFGLNTQTNPDVLSNTRTIAASRFAQWFTNYNNLHTAHHFHQGVPLANIEDLQRTISTSCEVVEPSYWSFYSGVIKGRINYQDPSAETCMTR